MFSPYVLPVDRKPLDSKWIFKIKTDAEGNVTKYKARLAIKGFIQKAGIDFDEIFAPVIRMESIDMLCSLACENDLLIHQMDVQTAFLNG